MRLAKPWFSFTKGDQFSRRFVERHEVSEMVNDCAMMLGKHRQK
jgi:hypothetical protein